MPRHSRFGRQPIYVALARTGMTRAELSRLTGVKYPHLNRLARGEATPSPDVRDALAGALGVPVVELFTPEALAAPVGHRSDPWAVS